MNHDDTPVGQKKLLDALQSLGAENAATLVPQGLEEKVLRGFDARHRPGRVPPRPRWSFPAAVTALAAALAIIAFVTRRPVPPPPRADAPFVAIPYVAPLAPYERAEIRRMDVPLAALLAAGLEVHVTNANGSVRADVVLGQDGRPLAIRIVKTEI